MRAPLRLAALVAGALACAAAADAARPRGAAEAAGAGVAPSSGAPLDGRPAPAGSGTLVVEGVLTRKGPDLDSFWAVTDARGHVWQLVDVDPALAAELWRLQGAAVRVEAEWVRRRVHDELRVHRIGPRG